MAQQRVQRRLAAILAADIAGYSRLMGRDEAGTARQLRDHLAAVHAVIERHDGRIVKTMGDGLLIEFPSAVAAVEGAITLQRRMERRNARQPADRRMLFRIGVNLGDVLVHGDDILGDGVNVAARLESLAPSGGICLSQAVYEQVKGKVDARFRDLGSHRLKNIAEPVRAYGVEGANLQPAAVPLPLPDEPSIVVLPFANLSEDPEQAFLADGISEDLTTALSRLRWLFVIARNSAFAYKDKSVDVRTIARELGVRYAVEGSVRRAGDHIRITAQLVDAEKGGHIWAERYDRRMDDIFAVQDEITGNIVASIEPHLYAREGYRATSKPPESIDVWGLVARAIALVNRFGRSEN
jgi:adenylate cyclase